MQAHLKRNFLLVINWWNECTIRKVVRMMRTGEPFSGHKVSKEDCLRREMRSSVGSSSKFSTLFHRVRICHLSTVLYNSRPATLHRLWDDPVITDMHCHLATSCGIKLSTLVSIVKILSDYVNIAFYKILHC